jgi:hypothetical protein
VTDRIVQTTWTDGGPHQPLPFPDDPRDDDRAAWEKEWINKTVGWLLDACEDPFDNQWLFQGTWYATEAECETAIRAAIETPDSGERREGE